MKVVHVIWSATIGGIERVVMDLIQAQLSNPALKPALLIGKSSGEMLLLLKSLPIEVHQLGMTSGMNFCPIRFKKAKKIFNQYDIIHIHSYNPLIAKAASAAGRKIIYTEHGNFGFGKNTSVNDRIVRYLLKQFLNSSVHCITFNSGFTAKQSAKIYGLKGVLTQIVYNGIPFNKIIDAPPADLAAQLNGKFVVGTIARMAGVKRIDRLINLFAEFAKGKECRLLLIGDGPIMNEMKQLAYQHSIADKIIFTGYRKDARACLQLMDVCAFPSENEAFGLVAIEAWDAGKPVISFADAGGLAELVSQQNIADLVTDQTGFINRLNYYYQNTSVIKLEAESRRLFARKFSIEKMESELFTIYRNVRN